MHTWAAFSSICIYTDLIACVLPDGNDALTVEDVAWSRAYVRRIRMCLTVYKIQHRDHPRKQAVVHFKLAYVRLLPSLRYP